MDPLALDLLDEAIADLEAKLNLPPGGSLPSKGTQSKPAPSKRDNASGNDTEKGKKKEKKKEKKPEQPAKAKNAAPNLDQPEICKLEFKVGVIKKVWVHPDADKLYCEEIDCGEETPRQIASGLRLHYSEQEMLGRRLLVVANLKPKKLAGFKSHGMVLCASGTKSDGGDLVEFVEPPEAAPLGEVVTFEGLPPPEPLSAAQVDKRKVFAACMAGMRTTDDCIAVWDGHAFMTSAGPCKSKTVKGGPLK